MGLPSGIKWATCNVGASSPEDFGSYFAWGEIVPKDTYTLQTYKYFVGGNVTKYNTLDYFGTVDNKTVLDKSDDAARVNWGGKWRMPTMPEVAELLNGCVWEETVKASTRGYIVTSKYNGNSIFLPKAGKFTQFGFRYAGTSAAYWTSSSPLGLYNHAFALCAPSFEIPKLGREDGLTVRPVTSSEVAFSVTDVKININDMELIVGESRALVASVEPWNASNQEVIWRTSDDAVATVDMNGMVVGVGVGYARITVVTKDEGLSAYCDVNVSKGANETKGRLNGYEWVDLGLPSGLKWATCNVGATSPEDYGGYYAWGETTTKSRYSWRTYKYAAVKENVWNDELDHITKYGNDGKTTLELSDDSANVNWGGSWRMPTLDEFNELGEYCLWIWTIHDGTFGCKVTSTTNGNSIFLPAAGSDSRKYKGWECMYWSSTLCLKPGFSNPWEGAMLLDINSSCFGVDGNVYPDAGLAATNRKAGASIRPVTE